MIGIADVIGDIYKNQSATFQQGSLNAYHTICIRYGNVSKRILTIALSSYTCVSLINMIQPVILLIMNGGYEIRIQYPGIDQRTFHGSLILISFSALVLLYFFLVLASTDIFTMILFVNMRLISSFVTGNLDELEDNLRPYQCNNRIRIKQQFVQIILMNRKYNE